MWLRQGLRKFFQKGEVKKKGASGKSKTASSRKSSRKGSGGSSPHKIVFLIIGLMLLSLSSTFIPMNVPIVLRIFLAMIPLGAIFVAKKSGNIPDKMLKIVSVLLIIATIMFLVPGIIGLFSGGTSSTSSYGSKKNPIQMNTDSYYETLEEPGDEVWFEYRAHSEGMHTISVTDCNDPIELDVYLDDKAIDGASGMNAKLPMDLYSGNTYLICVRVNGYDTNFTMNVKYGAGAAMAQTVYNGSNYVEFKDSTGITWVKFSPDKSGEYVFSLDASQYVYLTLYNENESSLKSTSGSGTGVSLSNYLTSENVYYLKIEFNGYTTSSVELNVFADDGRSKNAMNIYANSSQMVNILYGSTVWLKFTPNQSAYYKFNHNSGEVIQVSVYEGLDTSYTTSENITSSNYMQCYLNGGKTYFIKLNSPYNRIPGQFSFGIERY